MKNIDSTLKNIIDKTYLKPIGYQPSSNMIFKNYNKEIFDEDMCIYIHIPFCEKRCSFCSFFSTINYTEESLEYYTNAVINEINLYSKLIFGKKKVKSIHFGGGTPTLMSTDNLKRIIATIFEKYDTSEIEEITIEANPASLDEKKILEFSKISNLKINIGVQTFNNNILKCINRKNDVTHILRIIELIKNSNITNFGIDLICGLPDSSIETCEKDIDYAFKLKPDLITLYPLWIEKNTSLGQSIEKQKKYYEQYYQKREIFKHINKILLKNGYEKKSIYHWTIKGKENFIYGQKQMKGGEWLGIGAGAGSYISEMSFNNISNVEKYIKTLLKNNLAIDDIYYINSQQRFLRNINYSLRFPQMDLNYFRDIYGDILVDSLNKKITYLQKINLLEISNNIIKLTYDGILNLNYVEKYITED